MNIWINHIIKPASAPSEMLNPKQLVDQKEDLESFSRTAALTAVLTLWKIMFYNNQ